MTTDRKIQPGKPDHHRPREIAAVRGDEDSNKQWLKGRPGWRVGTTSTPRAKRKADQRAKAKRAARPARSTDRNEPTMRVAYVGNFGPEWSTENDVRLALEELGCDVIPLQENQIKPNELRREALESDLLLWTGTWDDAQPLYDTLDTFAQCARARIPTAAYHLDTFWSTHRDGRKWWMHPMFHTSHVFTADGDHQQQWNQLGVRHHWLRPGVRHTACYDGTPRDEFKCDVAFVGADGRTQGYHPEWTYRTDLIDVLVELCERNGWSFRNPGGLEPKVDRSEMNDFYASAAVTVGDSLCPKRENSRYWSDRVYEATGRGGVLIMPQIDRLRVEFEHEMSMYNWGDWADLETVVGLLLEGNREPEQRCTEITRRSHTYVNRMITLLETVTR